MRWIDHHAVQPSFYQEIFSSGLASDEIISAYAQLAMKSFLCMLSKRLNHFLICSASDEIVFLYAQHAFGCTCKNCQHFTAG
jgi:hypothetical protein